MDEDAILSDVSAETPAAPVLSERDLAMQAIQDEIANQYADPAPEAPEPVAEATPAPEPAKVRVKVDGEEKEVSQEELIKGYQKDSVASKRLEEASRKQKELDSKEQELAERERQIALQSLPAPVGEQDEEIEQAVINALVEGDNETAAKLLRDAIAKGRQPATPAPDPRALAAEIKEDLKAEQAAATQKLEFADFAKANPLFAEPAEGELYTPQRVRGDYLFANLYGKQWEAGEISYREALDQTAAHVAKEFTPTPAPAVSEREQRKQKIDNIPVASAVAAQVKTERTHDDVLNEMRKARGQVI